MLHITFFWGFIRDARPLHLGPAEKQPFACPAPPEIDKTQEAQYAKLAVDSKIKKRVGKAFHFTLCTGIPFKS